MRIGLDFDNTIVRYDEVFHDAAVDWDLIPGNIPVSKLAVRNYLRRLGKDLAWTELQGYVYGLRMCDASVYPGVIEFIRSARMGGAELFIVSHKTRYPFVGPRYNLHDAAAKWIAEELSDRSFSFIDSDHVFFESTKEEKIARIASCACDYFIDDLPEILRMHGFPVRTEKLLFDPEGLHDSPDIYRRFSSWEALLSYFEVKWMARA
jgi:hypothetical protein